MMLIQATRKKGCVALGLPSFFHSAILMPPPPKRDQRENNLTKVVLRHLPLDISNDILLDSFKESEFASLVRYLTLELIH